MQERPQHHVWLYVDGPNADNQAAAVGAYFAFPQASDVRLGGIVISATAVNYADRAPIGSRDIEQSRQAHHLHTARMAGLFARAGWGVPVFLGLDIEDTNITSPIPHSAHVLHEDYDIYGDATGLGREAIAGDFNDALEKMRGLGQHKIHLVCGGPFDGIARTLDDQTIFNRLGVLTAQAGFAFSERAIYSKLAFNVDVDLDAGLETFLRFPGPMYNAPSDITRQPDATFKSAEELMRLGVYGEIADIFIRHRARATESHKAEQIRQELQGKELKPYPDLSIHDLQAVMALQQALGLDRGVFQFESIDPDQAMANVIRAAELRPEDRFSPAITPERIRELGYLGAGQTVSGLLPPRLVVASQDTAAYKRRVPHLLGAARSIDFL